MGGGGGSDWNVAGSNSIASESRISYEKEVITLDIFGWQYPGFFFRG